MKTIDIRFLRLEEAAAALVAAAPARGDYYGIVMRARFSTTLPTDVLAQYRRTLRDLAMSYGNRLPQKQRDRMRCGKCGATGCKMDVARVPDLRRPHRHLLRSVRRRGPEEDWYRQRRREDHGRGLRPLRPDRLAGARGAGRRWSRLLGLLVRAAGWLRVVEVAADALGAASNDPRVVAECTPVS